MGPITAISVYLIVWWVVFLAVLPHGSHSYHDRGEAPPPGIEPGVPVNPNMKKKFLVTSAIAAGVFVVLYLVIASGVLTLPPVAQTY